MSKNEQIHETEILLQDNLKRRSQHKYARARVFRDMKMLT